MQATLKNGQLLRKYLSSYPEDLERILLYTKDTGAITNTAYVMNLISVVRERNVYAKDPELERHVASLDDELVGSSWEMSSWYSAQYHADVMLSVYRNREKVTEGIYECSRCLSKRTRQRTKKASGDEAIPVEIICVGCGNTWSE